MYLTCDLTFTCDLTCSRGSLDCHGLLADRRLPQVGGRRLLSPSLLSPPDPLLGGIGTRSNPNPYPYLNLAGMRFLYHCPLSTARLPPLMSSPVSTPSSHHHIIITPCASHAPQHHVHPIMCASHVRPHVRHQASSSIVSTRISRPGGSF